jgi:hypothetical protein
MGRTVPSYRIASEWEKRKWKPFRERLDKRERKIFDEMMCIMKKLKLTDNNWSLSEPLKVRSLRLAAYAICITIKYMWIGW